MSAQGDASTQGRAPSPPPLQILLCFYNLWLEAVLHSILSSVAVAVVQRGSRNNCVPCRGCLNCWNKLLSPPTPHPQNTYAFTHISAFIPLTQTTPYRAFFLSVRDHEEHAIYLGNNHFTRRQAYRQCRVKSLGSAPWAAPVFSFVPPPNWYWMVSQRGAGCITVGAAPNPSLDRTGSRDSSQQLQF